MELPIVSTYTSGQQRPQNSFYVLCKGENAGKPLYEPCPNCFTVRCSSATDAQFWYFLSWGLWKSQSFRVYLRGSVIPFIRICDYSAVIAHAGKSAAAKPEKLQEAIKTMQSIEDYEQLAKQKLALLAQAKIAVYRKFLQRA